MKRPDITKGLIRASTSYLLKLGYSCTTEIGIQRRGRRKVDVLAINLRSELIICEVKSGIADFRTDKKWQTYLPHCNKFYWVFTHETAQLLESEFANFKKLGCGVLVLDKVTGYLKAKVPAKRRKMLGEDKRNIITRLAWRAGEVSKRTSRRVRVFFED